jgi:hypothetical protein
MMINSSPLVVPFEIKISLAPHFSEVEWRLEWFGKPFLTVSAEAVKNGW